MKKIIIVPSLVAIAFATASYAEPTYTMPVQSVLPIDHQLGVPVFERTDNWGTEGYCLKDSNTDEITYVKVNRATTISGIPDVLTVASSFDMARNTEIHQFLDSHKTINEDIDYRYGNYYAIEGLKLNS